MKKFILFILLVLIFSITYQPISIDKALCEIEDIEIVVFSNEKLDSQEFKSTKNGIGYKTVMPYSELENIKNLNIRGINYIFKGNIENVNNVLSNLKADVVATQKLENITLIYAYSSHLKNYVKVKDMKMNIQIAMVEEKIIIGMPIILGSY